MESFPILIFQAGKAKCSDYNNVFPINRINQALYDLTRTMAKKNNFIPQKFQPWIEARKKYRLTHAQIQMARELGMNPKKFGSFANNCQQSWKLPLPEFIEECYRKRFGKQQPDDISSIEERLKVQAAKKASRREMKLQHKANETDTI